MLTLPLLEPFREVGLSKLKMLLEPKVFLAALDTLIASHIQIISTKQNNATKTRLALRIGLKREAGGEVDGTGAPARSLEAWAVAADRTGSVRPTSIDCLDLSCFML